MQNVLFDRLFDVFKRSLSGFEMVLLFHLVEQHFCFWFVFFLRKVEELLLGKLCIGRVFSPLCSFVFHVHTCSSSVEDHDGDFNIAQTHLD